MTLVTGDATWVQIKVTIFNALFAVFLIVGLVMKKNFFQYIFEKTFHYTREGWDKLTWSFAVFFIVLAGANEYRAHHVPSGPELQHPRHDDGRGERLDHVQDRHHHAGDRHLCMDR